MSLALTTARLALGAWVGAAALFVITSTREVTSPQIDSVTRDQLVLLRFPAYYIVGFALVGTALICGLLARNHRAVPLRRMQVTLLLLAAAVVLMGIDLVWVYRPLAELISPPGQPRTPQFLTLHQASKWMNAADVGLCLLAAVLLCWPGGRHRPDGDDAAHA